MTAHSPVEFRPAPDGAATAATGAALRRGIETETLGIVGAPFALAAKLVESAGFDAIYLSGAAFSAGTLGVPDIGLFTRDQLVEQVAEPSLETCAAESQPSDTARGGPRRSAPSAPRSKSPTSL